MKKIMYHIHNLNENENNNSIWKVGNVIDNTSDEFVNTFYSKGITTDAKMLFNDHDASFTDILDYFYYLIIKNGRISKQITKKLLIDAAGIIRNRNVLCREIILEEVRKTYYPHLISRKNCIWLCDLDQLDFWKTQLSNNCKIFKVEIDGDLFISSDSLLPGDADNYEDMVRSAHNYWNPKLINDEKTEYLFRGKLKILEELIFDKIDDDEEMIEKEESVYNELVRDNVLDIIKNNGGNPIASILDEDEYQEELLEKLYQETIELSKTENKKERLKKCAVVLEVINSIIKNDGYIEEDLREEQEIQKETYGSFEKRIYLKKVVD